MYYGGFSFTEAMNLPLEWRRWFIQRIQKEHQKSETSAPKNPATMNDMRRLLSSEE